MTVMQQIGMLTLGIRDSISLQWIKKVLLYVDPQTKKVHPSSKVLFDSLKSSIIKIFLYTIIVPKIFEYFDFLSISSILKIIYLILTYGYLFFYNNDILVSTQKQLSWQQKRTPRLNFQLDKVQNIQFFTLLSGQIKGFIFLLFYYVPIFLIETQVLTMIPYFGKFIFILSEGFFNGVFYFMKTWPFDKYNIGFMEKNISYMMGYGLTVSFVCNYCLSGSYATGAYLIMSLWMLINSVIYSPPIVEFKSTDDIYKYFSKQSQRKKLKNAYNEHRRKIRKDPIYREYIVHKIFLVYPALKITSYLNKRISIWMQKHHPKQANPNQSQNEQKIQDISPQTSGNTSKYPSVIVQVDQEKQQESSSKINEQHIE